MSLGPLTPSFLTPNIMNGQNWRALELAVIRLLKHCGWSDVQDVGQTGDLGADILAVRRSKESASDTYLFQVKSVSGAGYVGISAIDQAIAGQAHYKTKNVVVVTNGEFRKSAYRRRDDLNREGFNVRLWNGSFIKELLSKWPEFSANRRTLRPYQQSIHDDLMNCYQSGRRKGLFILATGLGKTVVAAETASALHTIGMRRVLVLCHSIDLAHQLQEGFWSQLSKVIPTQLFMDGEPVAPINGISIGLYQTLFSNLGGLDKDAFDLIIVDEAHHALASAFTTCINHLQPKLLIGMTATPWRGDGASIEEVFGEPISTVSLIDGMKMGYLSTVDYRVMSDDIDWDEIPKLSNKRISIRDLNKRLFIPQRDDAIIRSIQSVLATLPQPKVAVFSPSKTHAKEFTRKLNLNGIASASVSIKDKLLRRRHLMDFAAGKLCVITAVDVLNEGIDIPCLNVLVFLRATHSRRIFVQQLGRGLRLSPGKSEVVVLDYVSDIRRIAAVRELNKEAKEKSILPLGEIETVYLNEGIVSFQDEGFQSFAEAWLNDVSNLEDFADSSHLSFPAFGDNDGC